jgi:hypothetical protein
MIFFDGWICLYEGMTHPYPRNFEMVAIYYDKYFY